MLAAEVPARFSAGTRLPGHNHQTVRHMPPPSTQALESVAPLCVDLDGTLIKTDLVWESLVRLIKRNPIFVLIVPFWLLRGRAYLKRQISQRVSVDAASLPYNQPFLE